MPQEEGRGPKGPKWALYSVGLVVPHHLKTVNSVSFSTHSVLEDSSKHVGSAFCHYGKLPEMVILLRKRFSWLTVSEVAVCDWMDLWLWAGAAGATLWWACMVEQDSLYYKPEARGEREEERSVHTHSESVPLGLKPSHSPLFKPLPPPKHATLGTRPREMEPNYSRWQGRLSFKKRFRGIFWLFSGCHHCELSLWSTGSVHHSYCFLSGKNIAATFGRLFSMCKTENPGTTNALHSSNQALMDHCSVFEWCIPWGRGGGEGG